MKRIIIAERKGKRNKRSKISFFFFSFKYFLKIFCKKSLYINGVLCQNYFYFFSFLRLIIFQVVWSKYFFLSFKNQYLVWIKLFKKKKFFKWLYFFRRKIQKKIPKKTVPKWLYRLGLDSFKNSWNLESSFWILTFHWMPYINLLTNLIILKYVNIYNHRLYLWKHII